MIHSENAKCSLHCLLYSQATTEGGCKKHLISGCSQPVGNCLAKSIAELEFNGRHNTFNIRDNVHFMSTIRDLWPEHTHSFFPLRLTIIFDQTGFGGLFRPSKTCKPYMVRQYMGSEQNGCEYPTGSSGLWG